MDPPLPAEHPSGSNLPSVPKRRPSSYSCAIEVVVYHRGVGHVIGGWIKLPEYIQGFCLALLIGDRPLNGSFRYRERTDLKLEVGTRGIGFEFSLAVTEARRLLDGPTTLAIGDDQSIAIAEKRLVPQRWAFEIEIAGERAISGWVVDLLHPELSAMILLRIDGRLVPFVAETERADVELAPGVHGRAFAVELPHAGGGGWAEFCLGDHLNPIASLRLPGASSRRAAVSRLTERRAAAHREGLASISSLRPKLSDLDAAPAMRLPKAQALSGRPGTALLAEPSARLLPALDGLATGIGPGTWAIANGLHDLRLDCDGRGGPFPFLKPRPTKRLLRQLPAATPVLLVPEANLTGWTPADDFTDLVALLLDRLGPPALLTDILYAMPGAAAAVEPAALPVLPNPAPLVSLVVPSRDNLGHLAKLVATAAALRRRYPALELVVVDNDSRSPTTAAFLDFAVGSGSDWIRVVRDGGGFNFSRLSNLGARAARGTVLLFCNDDVEIGPDFDLAAFVGHLAEPDVGIVGHTLLYEDGTIQHAGVVVGAYDAADNGQTAFTIDEGGYFGLARITREVTAVTGAFMAVRRDVFEQLAGFDERDFAISFNDVDLCLRAGRAGWTVLNAYCGTVHHHESVSRGRLPDRQAVELAEVRNLRRIWDTANFQDPYYSPGFDRHALPYTRPLWQRIGLTPPPLTPAAPHP